MSLSKEKQESSLIINNLIYENKLIKSIDSDDLKLDDTFIIKKTNYYEILFSILFGQLLSLLSVGNGYFNQYVQNKKKLITPLLLNASYYLLLFILYGIIILKLKIAKPKLIYIIISIFDTQANYINIFIFSFSIFEYPYIINVLSSIWSVLFTLILIKTKKYLINHILGIIICLIGVFLLFLGTFNSFQDFIDMFKNFNNQMKGLLLSVLVSILYGLNAVLLEKYITNDREIQKYCSWLGIIGFCLSIVQSFIPISSDGFEFKILVKIGFDSNAIIICWILSAISLAAITSLTPFYIRLYSANLFNISLLFTIFWSFIIDSLFIKNDFKFKWFFVFYFIGFFIVIVGTIIFSREDRITIEEIPDDESSSSKESKD
jgi:drug/metabolite transporter (DMT)-like permease